MGAEVATGTRYVISATATGATRSQWYKGGVAVGAAGTGTTTGFVITAASAADAGQYKVQFSNSAGVAESDVAVITVK